jgi:hypothetical protein
MKVSTIKAKAQNIIREIIKNEISLILLLAFRYSFMTFGFFSLNCEKLLQIPRKSCASLTKGETHNGSQVINILKANHVCF